MMATRQRDVLYAAGQVTSVMDMLVSKAVKNVFMVNFAQRRLNTSYSRRLCRATYRLSYREIRLRERWGMDANNYPYSAIEIVMVPRNGEREREEVLGWSYSDGTLFISERFWEVIPRRFNWQISVYISNCYDCREEATGKRFTPKARRPNPVTAAPLQDGETFGDIVSKGWRV